MNGYIELQPWPPRRQDCNNLLGDTIKLCCSLWSIFCLGWFSLQFVPPWSLHVLLEIKCDGVQLWPFFCSYAVLVLMNTSALVFHLGCPLGAYKLRMALLFGVL